MGTKKKQKVVEDYSASKPGLHHLYFKWAIRHLRKLDWMISELSTFGNIHMMMVADKIRESRDTLVAQYQHYAEASAFLQELDADSKKNEEE